MKPAVFKVDHGNGFVRLICIDVPSLRHAVEIERALREVLPGSWHISLLGRFDKIEIATGPADLLHCAAVDPDFVPGSNIFSSR
jgi:hypothetical protein